MTSQFDSLSGLFEPGLWRQAGWFAVTYLTPRDVSPTLGLVFRDRDVATAIFTGWQHALGSTDTEDRVRVAIIEGSVKGSSGDRDYYVHLSQDPDAVPGHRRVAGGEAGDAVGAARHDVWLSMRGRTPLSRFKEAYQRANRYLLLPGVIDRTNRVELMPHLAIAMHRLVLRQVGDIVEAKDPDAGLWSR